jgi:hypothetical protein
MKTRTLKTSVVVLAFAAMSAFGQSKAINGQSGFRAAVAAAETSADHTGIAINYTRLAAEYAQKQAEELRIATKWGKLYGNWTKSPNPYRSALNLAAYYGKLASEAQVHAREQKSLSGALNDSKMSS